MNKILIGVISIVITLLVLAISIIINIRLLQEHVWKDESVKAIEIAILQPQLFKIPDDYHKRIIELYNVYKTVNTVNLPQFNEFGNTIFEVKNNSILRALKLIGDSTTRDFRAYKLYTPGGTSHAISAYALGLENYSNDEIITYINNMTKIMEAIPKNLPDKKVLTKESINSITYYVDYARIVYDTDKKIESIDNDRTKFIGKRYIGKF